MTLAGHREVWTASHGRAGRFHVAVNVEAANGARAEHGTAACSPCTHLKQGNRRIILGDLVDAATIPEILRCQRPACRKRWP